jgi:hypothetical protein
MKETRETRATWARPLRLPSVLPPHTDSADPPARAVLDARTAARTARWAGVLFVTLILIQRVSVPGLPVPMLLPVLLAWVALAWQAGVVEIDPRRLMFWCTAFGLGGLAMLVQTMAHPGPVISVSSWALLFVMWLPAVVRFVDRRRSTYEAVLRIVVRVAAVFATGCIVFVGIQLLGVPYRDVLADVVPAVLLEQGWTISSPLQFDSPIYRANAWVATEPSMASYQIGIGLLAGILVRARMWVLALLVVGMFTTVAGSGFLLVLIGVLVLLFLPGRRLLIRMVPSIAVAVVLLFSTPFGQNLLERTDEATGDRSSSASLRAIQPYEELWPTWSTLPETALLGGGPGSSQRVVDVSVLRGLVPLPAKLFYDYGVIFGVVVAAFLIFCYVDGLSSVFALAFFLNLWTIQPGSNIAVFVIPVLLLVTWWAPRREPTMEQDPPRRGS